MEENLELSENRREDGFIGEQMIVLPTEAFSDYVENPLVRRLYLTDVGFFPKAGHHYMNRKEGIEEYILLCCTEGEGVIEMQGKKYILKKGEAFCVPRYRAHVYYAREENPWSILWVHFKGEDTRFYPLEECKIIPIGSTYAINRIRFLFEQLFRILEGSYTLGNFIYISQVLSLILADIYAREKREIASQNKHVTNMIKYMYQHMDEKLTLDDLAGIFGLSKGYINAVFLKCTQHAPIDFFIILKMREACKLMREQDLYIYQVAQRLGYKDQYYFSRLFKKVVGVSPENYKKGNYSFYQ